LSSDRIQADQADQANKSAVEHLNRTLFDGEKQAD
jgi:hypothetical protein